MGNGVFTPQHTEEGRGKERHSLIIYLEDDGFRPWPNLPTGLANLPYTQTCTYNNDTILTLQNILTVLIFHQNYFTKNTHTQKTRDTSKCFEMALKEGLRGGSEETGDLSNVR